ncbi:uncharacterized protein LOC108676809 [Hyalella azteca]|uniref:Uncharacterized protein LOC108676809 n=1 Tax=Hyalella azteca TaxID=294128 RepID=A0A8B7P5S6_HYAAZ|nr:uncharacterized protein LOC108676809 [Hyalella azteca]
MVASRATCSRRAGESGCGSALWTRVDWVKLNSSGTSTDIIACANAAFARNALMFKINGSCYASGRIVYDVENDEQDCGDAPAEVVYVMTPLPGQLIGDTFLFYNESSADGCLLSNSDNTGHVFDDSENTPYDSGLMPQKLTCCNEIIAGHCVEIASRPASTYFSYCEAKTRCEALGLQLASYELETNPGIQTYAHEKLGPIAADMPFWVNTQREEGGYYRWLPDGQNNTIPIAGSDDPLAKCAGFNAAFKTILTFRCKNLNNSPKAICIGPNTSLKKC